MKSPQHNLKDSGNFSILLIFAGVMYTCDAFGMHYCEEEVFDKELEELSPHLRFYYDCLMKPNARSVLTALKKVKDLEFSTIATGHGPLLRYNVDEIVGRYTIRP